MKITPRQVKAIRCLLTANTMAEGLKAAGVPLTLFHKWLHQPEFKQQMDIEAERLTEEANHTFLATAQDAALLMTSLYHEDHKPMGNFDRIMLNTQTAKEVLDRVLGPVDQE
jgi:hypothetical protein